MNKIALAVMPLKTSAIERAEKEAKDLVARYTEKLVEVGFDLDIAAPYPRNVWGNSYHAMLAKRNTFCMIAKSVKGARRHGEPAIYEICPEYITKFIENSKRDAAEQYDAFIAKLITKIGEVTEAKMIGDHVWSFSILTINKPDGTVENWKTQMIVNVSKLGKLFNQWPSRKVKNK